MHSMLDRRMMEVVVTIGAITVQISSSIVTIKKLTPVFYRPDALPMAQKNSAKVLNGNIHRVFGDKCVHMPTTMDYTFPLSECGIQLLCLYVC